MKYKLVPIRDIEAVEEARKKLYDAGIDVQLLLNITSPLWHITHRRYKEFDCEEGIIEKDLWVKDPEVKELIKKIGDML